MATEQELKKYLPLVASGKVRNLYEVDADTLLFVASDRVSAFDVVLKTPIPQKGKLLTLMSEHWFGVLSAAVPDLKHHFLTTDLPAAVPAALHEDLRGRCMQVRRLRVLPIEAIVRGYITGSAWAEYRASGTVHGGAVAPGLLESEVFPRGAIYTPSTKAEAGQHDENISAAEAARVLGRELADRVEALALRLYAVARDAAAERGIVIADTKFEFGVDDATGDVVLVDEVLTPDSSRFWPKATYQIGRAQDSFDKQPLRNWLTKEGLKGKNDVEIPIEVVAETVTRYKEAYEKLTGKRFD